LVNNISKIKIRKCIGAENVYWIKSFSFYFHPGSLYLKDHWRSVPYHFIGLKNVWKYYWKARNSIVKVRIFDEKQ